MARDVEPLGVSYHGSAWYVVAWCRMREDYRYFKLERLHALEVLGERFAGRPDFSLRDYLQRAMKPEESFAATVWLSPDAAERARRESYARIKAERPANGGVEVDLQTFSLEWLSHWILSFGGEAEALAPAKLRTLVRTAAVAAAQRHQ
jgi:predicted DNA-binding transcriptional regulator YafY